MRLVKCDGVYKYRIANRWNCFPGAFVGHLENRIVLVKTHKWRGHWTSVRICPGYFTAYCRWELLYLKAWSFVYAVRISSVNKPAQILDHGCLVFTLLRQCCMGGRSCSYRTSVCGFPVPLLSYTKGGGVTAVPYVSWTGTLFTMPFYFLLFALYPQFQLPSPRLGISRVEKAKKKQEVWEEQWLCRKSPLRSRPSCPLPFKQRLPPQHLCVTIRSFTLYKHCYTYVCSIKLYVLYMLCSHKTHITFRHIYLIFLLKNFKLNRSYNNNSTKNSFMPFTQIYHF